NTDEKNEMPFVLQLLNQRKYPASTIFLLMTLGPLIALVPFAEKAKGRVAEILSIFGKVPMFYYLLHVILIHLSALVVNFFRSGNIHQDWYGMAPFYTQQPEGVRWSLALMYLVWIVDVAILYFACTWYEKVKARHSKSLLRYI
ncbi:MAG: hypothetical protein ABUT20_38695, partial [Bacteroidota bacterium]